MKPKVLDFLVCPKCEKPFNVTATAKEGSEVMEGKLTCTGCGVEYPITGGIPRILPAELIEEQKRTASAFGWEWNKFPKLHDFNRYVEQFLDWIAPLTAQDVKGKTVLDGGCGMGRFSAVCSHLGAKEVVGFDISSAVEAAYQNTRELPNVHIVQSDIYNLPVRKTNSPFDFVFSIGVLHHLPNPKGGFCSLVKHVKPGGTMAAWVYGYESNEWIVRFVDPVRIWFTSRIPHKALYYLSLGIAVPLHLMLKVFYAPAEKAKSLGFLKRVLPYKYFFWLSRYGFKHNHSVIFDQLVAPKADYVKREDFVDWFDTANLKEKTITPRNENSWRGFARKPASAA